MIAGYVRHPRRTLPRPSRRCPGILITGHYNGKIDSPRLCSRALTRLEIETMKLGAQPGLTERRNSGPTGELSK